MNEEWIEISCQVPAELADIVAEHLAVLSGNGVCTENLQVDAFSPGEIKEPETATVRSYFSAAAGESARLLAEIGDFLCGLAERGAGFTPLPPQLSTVKTEDWSSCWKDNFRPLRIGRRLLIVPTWEKIEPDPDDLVLLIDPGMAFGTGGHETTRLCLELLENIMDAMPVMHSPNVLDVGTGSGILAMAAVKLGAQRVCALDIDPQAVDIARENMSMNGMLEQVECSAAPLESVNGNFDVILANILAEELVRLAPLLTDRLSAGGSLVLSGILTEKESAVLCGFASFHLHHVETIRQGEWVAIHYQKKGTF